MDNASIDSLSSLEFGATEDRDAQWEELSECSEAESSLLDEEELKDYRILHGIGGNCETEENSDDDDSDSDGEDATIKLVIDSYFSSPSPQKRLDCETKFSTIAKNSAQHVPSDSPNLMSFVSPAKNVTPNPQAFQTLGFPINVFSPPAIGTTTPDWNSFTSLQLSGTKEKLINFDESPLKERNTNVAAALTTRCEEIWEGKENQVEVQRILEKSRGSISDGDENASGTGSIKKECLKLGAPMVSFEDGGQEQSFEYSELSLANSPAPPKSPHLGKISPVAKSSTPLTMKSMSSIPVSRKGVSRIAIRSASLSSSLPRMAATEGVSSSPEISLEFQPSRSLSPKVKVGTTTGALLRPRATSISNSRISPDKKGKDEAMPSRFLRRSASTLCLSPSKSQHNTKVVSPPKRVFSPIKESSFASPTATSLLKQRSLSSLSLFAGSSRSPSKDRVVAQEKPRRSVILPRKLKEQIPAKGKDDTTVDIKRPRMVSWNELQKPAEEEEREKMKIEQGQRKEAETKEEDLRRRAAVVFGVPSTTTTNSSKIATRSTRVTRSTSMASNTKIPIHNNSDLTSVSLKRTSPPPKKSPSFFESMNETQLKQLTKENTAVNCRTVIHAKVVVQYREENRPPSPTAKIRRTSGDDQLRVSREERALKRRALKKSTDSARRASMGLAPDIALSDDEEDEPLEHFRAPGDEEQFYSPVKKRSSLGTHRKQVKWDRRLVEKEKVAEELSLPLHCCNNKKGCIKYVKLDEMGNSMVKGAVPGVKKMTVTITKVVYQDDE